MTVVTDAIAADLATLERVVDAPVGELGYGTDLSCVTDVTDDLAEVDPNSTTAIAESLLRRYSTPRGGLPDDPDYGCDVRGFANRGVTVAELRDLGGAARNEARKDDRVEDAEVIATSSQNGSVLAVSGKITPADPALGTFSFTFAVTGGQALLETITP